MPTSSPSLLTFRTVAARLKRILGVLNAPSATLQAHPLIHFAIPKLKDALRTLCECGQVSAKDRDRDVDCSRLYADEVQFMVDELTLAVEELASLDSKVPGQIFTDIVLIRGELAKANKTGEFRGGAISEIRRRLVGTPDGGCE